MWWIEEKVLWVLRSQEKSKCYTYNFNMTNVLPSLVQEDLIERWYEYCKFEQMLYNQNIGFRFYHFYSVIVDLCIVNKPILYHISISQALLNYNHVWVCWSNST